MIFQHTWRAVLEGRKTQTRRLVKPTDGFTTALDGETITEVWYTDRAGNIRSRWEVGKDYAVQPARGQRAVGRILVARIRCEDVRHISDEDVYAEGYIEDSDFFGTWLTMHDKPALRDYEALCRRGVLVTRSVLRYRAWALTFELVESEVTDDEAE